MPRIAVKSVLAAKNNALPDYWEFFSVSKKQERLTESVLPYRQSLLNMNSIQLGVTQLNIRCRGSMFRHQCGARCPAYDGCGV